MVDKKPAMSPSEVPVEDVLDRVTGPRRSEAEQLLELHQQVSGDVPVVWANRIIGFGEYQYLYESGHGGNAPQLGFASNSSKHTLYLVPEFEDRWPDLMENLGKYKASKGCLYISRLGDVDRSVLRELLERTLAWTDEMDVSES